MKVVSVNVGQPREVDWHGRPVLTSIWKTPVTGPVRVGPVNLEGDRQSDLTVHGGPTKSVYVYPSEHYADWRAELPTADLPWGVFGENLTIEGLLEHEIRPGDRLRIGSAEFEVTVPRMPCFKLGIRFGDDLMVRRFARSGRSGFYLTVIAQGALQAGDEVVLDARAQDDVTIADLFAERLQ
jgi:MOSC domain-containing protein YiiM